MKRFALLAAMSVAMAGCNDDTSVPSERPSAQLSGTAADNIIKNGDVRVYSWDGQDIYDHAGTVFLNIFLL